MTYSDQKRLHSAWSDKFREESTLLKVRNNLLAAVKIGDEKKFNKPKNYMGRVPLDIQK